MRKLGLILFLLIISITACKDVTTKLQNWDFIQSVGGMKLGTPLKTQDGWYLPIICDVSGTTKITVKPQTLNSALKCLKLHAERDEKKIYITISTGVGDSNFSSAKCNAVNIGYMEDGQYEVLYQDDEKNSHLIDKINIKN